MVYVTGVYLRGISHSYKWLNKKQKQKQNESAGCADIVLRRRSFIFSHFKCSSGLNICYFFIVTVVVDFPFSNEYEFFFFLKRVQENEW